VKCRALALHSPPVRSRVRQDRKGLKKLYAMNTKQAYEDYLKTDYWREVSSKVKERAGYRCQVCNSPEDLEAHHRTYSHRGDELNHLEDLTCLCRRCHHGHHFPAKPEVKVIVKEIVVYKKAKKQAKQQRKPKWTPSSESLMPPGNWPITLTKKLIQQLRTDAGGFTSATLRALGVPVNPVSGWSRKLVGRIIERHKYREALDGRNIFAKTK